MCWTCRVVVAGSPGLGPPRFVRAATLATIGVAFGSIAHSAAGGCLDLVGLAGGCVVLGSASWLLVQREVSGPVLLPWLALTQVFMHLVLHAACLDGSAEPRRRTLMLAAHIAAVTATSVALRVGEAGLWAARRLHVAAGRLRRLLAFVDWVVPLPRRVAGVVAVAVLDGPSGAQDVVLGWRARRGPPTGLRSR